MSRLERADSTKPKLAWCMVHFLRTRTLTLRLAAGLWTIKEKKHRESTSRRGRVRGQHSAMPASWLFIRACSPRIYMYKRSHTLRATLQTEDGGGGSKGSVEAFELTDCGFVSMSSSSKPEAEGEVGSPCCTTTCEASLHRSLTYF